MIACSDDTLNPENNSNGNDNDNKTEKVDPQYQAEVIEIDSSMVTSVNIFDENTIEITSQHPSVQDLKAGDKFVYNPSSSAKDYFLGIVDTVTKNGNVYTISTTIPDVDDIFRTFDFSAILNENSTEVVFEGDEDDSVIYTGIVNNSVWDEIETVYVEETSESEEETPGTRAQNTVPVDITLSFEPKSNTAFKGKIYLRLQGNIYIHDKGAWEMNLNQIVGLKGSFSLAAQTKERTYIPLLQIKNGISLYSNKIVGVRLKPSFNFFYGGEIKLEAGFKYEVVNSNVHVVHDNGFYTNSVDNKKDSYFRVKSLHTEGEFGLSLNNDLYVFVFSDKFFSGGVKVVGGVTISGEKNVGIQFPDFANFDFSVSFSPFLEVTPFVAIKTNTLKRYEGATFRAETERFSVDLLPNIHDINYKKSSAGLKVSSKIDHENTSFINTKEDGIALFKAGSTTPVVLQSANNISTKAEARDVAFSMDMDEDYEIAKYSVTDFGEYVYGEHIPIYDDWLDLLYTSTNGDNWLRNDNWLSAKPLWEWYGFKTVSRLDLSYNNLTGDGIIKDCRDQVSINLAGNDLNSLYFENNDNLAFGYEINIDGLKLQTLTVNNCSAPGQQIIGHPYSEVTEINSILIENCDKLGRTFFLNVKANNIRFENCNFEGQGSSAEDSSNVKTLTFINCTIPDGRADNINGNLVINNCNIGNFWVIHGKYIIITNSYIEGRLVNFSGTEDKLQEYWYGRH